MFLFFSAILFFVFHFIHIISFVDSSFIYSLKAGDGIVYPCMCVCTISSETYTLMSDFSLELTIYRLSYPPDIATKTIFSETFHLQQVYETHVFLLLRYELSVIYHNEYTIYPFISDSLHYPNWYCLVLDSHQISARL